MGWRNVSLVGNVTVEECVAPGWIVREAVIGRATGIWEALDKCTL